MITITINEECLEYMRKMGMILDYTDDGFVYREDSGWIPAGDVIEFYLGMEEYELGKAQEAVREAQTRAGPPEKETKETQETSNKR